MSQQLPIPDRSPGGENANIGDIYIEAPVAGGAGSVVQIGHGNMAVFQLKVLGVKDATIRLNPQDPLLHLLTQMLADGSAQRNQLTSGGFSPTIAAPCLRAEDFQPDAPFRSPLGIPAPLAGDTDPLARNFASLYGFLGRLDQQFGGTLVGLTDGRQQGLNVSDLLLQKGNQALWRFRQGALRLFAEQASLYALAEPPNPTQPALGAFQAAARVNLDVLRGWVLFQKYRASQPALIDQAVFAALNQGRWQAVLDGWGTGQRLSQEQVQAEWSYLIALGERYDAQAVQTAGREAEWYFREALRRQPGQSAALVNLAALLAESALLTYIETGNADRARLQEAQSLFQQAHVLLDQRSDRDGKVALAQCLLYEATSLPPEARLEMVQWASSQAQQLRAALGPNAPGSVRWDIAQRNLARRDPSFIDWKKIEQARDILVGAGAMAILVTLAEQWLGTHAQLAALSQGGLQVGAGHHPLQGHPGHSSGGVSGHTGSPHMPTPGTHIPPGVTREIARQGAKAASKGAAHGLRHMLSTVAGKIVAGAVITAIVGASVVGVMLAHRTSGLASAYQGTGHNITVNATGSLVLTSVLQDQQKISGKVFWGFPLIGDGSFTGTIGSNGSIVLTDTPIAPDRFSSIIIFKGTLHPNGSLSGTYTAPSVSQTGTWQATPYQIPSNPHVVSTYHGTFQNWTVGGTATLALTSVVQNQQKISGKVIIGPGLSGSGSFTGTIGTDGSVTFTDNDTTDGFTVIFSGFLFSDGSLSGSYIIPSSGQSGIWKASPA